MIRLLQLLSVCIVMCCCFFWSDNAEAARKNRSKTTSHTATKSVNTAPAISATAAVTQTVPTPTADVGPTPVQAYEPPVVASVQSPSQVRSYTSSYSATRSRHRQKRQRHASRSVSRSSGCTNGCR